jgi:hypothetical protein
MFNWGQKTTLGEITPDALYTTAHTTSGCTERFGVGNAWRW